LPSHEQVPDRQHYATPAGGEDKGRVHGQSAGPPLSKPAMLRKLYDWCIGAAGKPHATWILGTVSFVESSFFPVPPDAMLIPMGLARPDKVWFYAHVCTLTSVAGGVLGYAIGYFLYESLGLWLIQLYGLSDKVEAFRQSYREWGALIIVLKGMTPFPYKIVTITSGISAYPIIPFILLSFVARGMRFYLVAFLISRYGVQARAILEKRLGLWVTLAAILLVGGIVAVVYLF
jgi:membrane protein YqaA with SNARE-associated domain